MAILAETKLKKAHVALMKHPETALYSGVILMGKSEVADNIPTAYTDGTNKRYGRKFMDKLTDPQARGVALHENLHVALKHLLRFTKEFHEDQKTINIACDFAVNAIVLNLNDRSFCELPEGCYYDAKYINWSVREIYDDIKKQNKGKGGNKGNKSSGSGEPEDSQGGGDEGDSEQESESITINGKEYTNGSIDEHDFTGATDMTAEEIKKFSEGVDRALREGGILAGKLGSKMPRAIQELLEPKIDWRHELREFVTSSTKGNSEYTWRKFNRRLLANDYYMPSMEDEAVGELIVAIDTSGSIGGVQLTEFASELASICEVCQPEKVRILWWDTAVHGEQVFEDNYSNIAGLLKPQGGGGTSVSCVSEYISKKKLSVDAVIVFTDGYTEQDIQWDISSPTLWMVTMNKHFESYIKSGRVVFTKEN